MPAAAEPAAGPGACHVRLLCESTRSLDVDVAGAQLFVQVEKLPPHQDILWSTKTLRGRKWTDGPCRCVPAGWPASHFA